MFAGRVAHSVEGRRYAAGNSLRFLLHSTSCQLPNIYVLAQWEEISVYRWAGPSIGWQPVYEWAGSTNWPDGG